VTSDHQEHPRPQVVSISDAVHGLELLLERRPQWTSFEQIQAMNRIQNRDELPFLSLVQPSHQVSYWEGGCLTTFFGWPGPRLESAHLLIMMGMDNWKLCCLNRALPSPTTLSHAGTVPYLPLLVGVVVLMLVATVVVVAKTG